MSRFIRLRTEIPGPRSRQLLELKERYIPRAIDVHVPVFVERAEGALLTDVDGNTFIDLTGGVGVLNVGHCHPEVVARVREHAGRFLHTDFSVVPYENLVRLAERLAARVPGPAPKKAFFFNSGAEAVENAVKIARLYTRRPAVIAFEGAFHGRTLMALSLTGRARPYRTGMGPMASEVYRVPYPYPYRKPRGLSDEDYAALCLEAVERAFVTQVAPEDVAAIVVEPVLGEGGFVVPPPGFLPGLREICDRHGIVLIVDEVQTGFGRTGRMFAVEHWGVEPDLMTVAKSLAAGLPLSGVVGKAEIMDAAHEGAIGGTYVGNPVACEAALAVLDVMEREDLPGRARRQGERIRRRLEALAERCPLIGDVRGLGAMMAVELVRDRETREPAPQETMEVIRRAMRRGVLLLKAGIYGNCIRLLAPLVITDEQLDEALDVIESVIAEVAARGAAVR